MILTHGNNDVRGDDIIVIKCTDSKILCARCAKTIISVILTSLSGQRIISLYTRLLLNLYIYLYESVFVYMYFRYKFCY